MDKSFLSKRILYLLMYWEVPIVPFLFWSSKSITNNVNLIYSNNYRKKTYDNNLMFLFFPFYIENSHRLHYSFNITLSLGLHSMFWLIPILSTSQSRISWILSSLWWIAYMQNVSNLLVVDFCFQSICFGSISTLL